MRALIPALVLVLLFAACGRGGSRRDTALALSSERSSLRTTQ